MAKATETAGGSTATKRPAQTPAAALPLMLAKRIPTSVGYVARKISEETNAATGQLATLTDLHILAMTEGYNKRTDDQGFTVNARKRNVMLLGPTGTGKTELVQEYCAKSGKPLVTVMPAMRPEHLIGQFIEDAEGKLTFQRGPLWVACELGNCVIYFDEINRLHEDVVPLLYPLLDRRRQLFIYEHGIKAVRRSTGEYLASFDPADTDQERWEGEVIVDLPDDVLIVASYNPGYAGTQALNEALRNRFEVAMVMDYSTEVEEGLIKCEAIRKLGQDLRNSGLHQGAITTPVSTNQLRSLEENIRTFGIKAAVGMFLAYFESDDERKIVEEALNLKYLANIRKYFSRK